MEGKNKFEQELYLRENSEPETREEMEISLQSQYRNIIKNNVGEPSRYKAKKFIHLCSKINEDLEALTKTISKALCVKYRVPVKSLPPDAMNTLELQLKKMGFDVVVVTEQQSNHDEEETIEYYKIKIRCKEGVTRDEENIENRDTEFSEP